MKEMKRLLNDYSLLSRDRDQREEEEEEESENDNKRKGAKRGTPTRVPFVFHFLYSAHAGIKMFLFKI